MDQFLEENACSDLLAEVIQESLKNCLKKFFWKVKNFLN